MKKVKEERLKEAQTIINQSVESLKNIKIDPSFSDIVEEILKCKGKIIVTAMGKAGVAMHKFSSTLCSLGFPSCYLHPGEASHGDLGLISKKDILFIASTSGKTREVLEIMDLSRKINVSKIIGITSHLDSPIREKVDLVLDMGIIKEAGHLGLAPTSSIMVMLCLTDALALTAAKEKKLTRKQYAKFHHGGYLGKIANGIRK